MSSTPVLSTQSARALITLACGILLVSCGGGEGSGGAVALPGPAADPVPTTSISAKGGTGQLTVRVVTPDDQALPNARVVVRQGSVQVTARTDSTGTVHLAGLPDQVDISVSHSFGSNRQYGVPTESKGTRLLTAAIRPATPATMALLPVVVPAGGLSADGRSLLLQFTVVASPGGGFQASSYGSYKDGSPSPYVNFNNKCMAWLDPGELVPSCEYSGEGEEVEAVAMKFDANGSGFTAPSAANTGSALLLVEQGQRTGSSDPFNLRRPAAWGFLNRAQNPWEGLSFSTRTVATFPATPGAPDWPLASVTSGTTLEILKGPGEGPAPVLAALTTASRLVAAQGAPRGQSALVALLGGGDDGGLTEPQRRNAMASLRQQQLDDGVRMVLVAGRLDGSSEERARLAEISAGLAAPLIFSGVPKDWGYWGNSEDQPDGQYLALDLAARIIAGERLPTLSATFRLHAEAGATFVSGSTLRGVVGLESDMCPMGCAELPLPYEVQVP